MLRIVWSYLCGVTAGLMSAWVLGFVELYLLFALVTADYGLGPIGVVAAVSLAIAGFVAAWQMRSLVLPYSLTLGSAAGFTVSVILVGFTTSGGDGRWLATVVGAGVTASLFGALLGAWRGARQRA